MAHKTFVSLSFDDGREDTYRLAFNIMKKYGLNGTIHVTTGYVDKTWDDEKWLISKGPISIEHLREMKDYGFEISSHGDKHVAEKRDFSDSISKLRNWNLVAEKVGFSIPNSELRGQEKYDFISYLEELDIVYMRGGRSPLCYTLKSKIQYVFYNITRIQKYYDLFNQYNCHDILDKNKLNRYDLFSLVVRREDNPNMLIRFIEGNAGKGKWIILMLHGIHHSSEATNGRDPWSWDATKFDLLCKELKLMSDLGEISVKPIIDVLDEI